MKIKIPAPFIIFEVIIWLACLGLIYWLWDQWFLSGPHGPFRWIGMDLIPFWLPVREMLNGANPYSPEITLQIQQLVYGGPALDQDPMMFVYPAWMFLPLLPLALLPLKMAAILYCGSLLWGFLNLVMFLAKQWAQENLIHLTTWALLLILGSLPFLMISVTKGQIGYFSLLALFISRRFWEKHPAWAGFFLSLALIKPTVTILPTALLLFWVLLSKNWRILASFLISISLLFAASLIAVGNWLPAYFEMLSSTGGMPVLWSLAILSPPWNWIYAFFVASIIFIGFIQSRQKNTVRPLFITAVLAGISLTPMRWIYDLFLGILIPAELKRLGKLEAFFTGLALIAPWGLAALPEASRGPAAIFGMPILWSFLVLTNLYNNHKETISEKAN